MKMFKNKINLITTFIHKSRDVTTIIAPQVVQLLYVLVLLNVIEKFIGVYV